MLRVTWRKTSCFFASRTIDPPIGSATIAPAAATEELSNFYSSSWIPPITGRGTESSTYVAAGGLWTIGEITFWKCPFGWEMDY